MKIVRSFGLVLTLGLVSTSAVAEVTTLAGADYANLCELRGVPLPPRWAENDPARPAWKYNGKIKATDVIIVRNRDAHVYYYQKSPGNVCMALPRFNPGETTAGLLGVICQGSTGKVCFWDGSDVPLNTPGVIASKNPSDLVGTRFKGGGALETHDGGMCTDCHRGENPFIVIPSYPSGPGALDIPVNRNTGFWYEPIIPARYRNAGSNLEFFPNRGPGTVLNGVVPPSPQKSCLDCHGPDKTIGRLPVIELLSNNGNSNYCATILDSIKCRDFMPPGGTNTSQVYQAHWQAIFSACANQPQTQTGSGPSPAGPRTAMAPALIVALQVSLR